MTNILQRFSPRDPAWKLALQIYIPLRLGISAWAALVLALSSAPTDPDPVLRPYLGIEPIEGGWEEVVLAPWQRFDTMWYLKIASDGYSTQDGSLVYFPLYPVLIRTLGPLVLGNYLLATLIISNLAFIGTVYLLYQLTARQLGEDAAKKAVLYLALFPTGFFLLAGYSESLFLFFTLLAFYWAYQHRWVMVGIAAFLASLTRLQGVILIFPLAYLAWQDRPQGKAFAPLLLIPLAPALFTAYGYFFLDSNILTAYQGLLYAQFVAPWENIGGAISILISSEGSFIDLFNLGTTFLFLAMTILIFRRLPREYSIYMAVTLFTLLLRRTTIQPLVSTSRYGLTLFPAFMLWGGWGQNKIVHRLILYPAFALYLYLAGQFFLWGWVA